MPERRISPTKAVLVWSATGAILITAAVAIVFDVAHRAAGMRAATTRAASVLNARPGARIDAVARLKANENNNTYSAQLLESSGETTYRETPALIRIALGADTSVLMGSGTDVKPGAVVQASGRMDGAHVLHASQLVILTGYVRVVSR